MQKITKFFKEIRGELKRVTWPDRKQVINSTVVVLVTVLISATFLYIVDIGLQQLLSLLL